MSGRRTESRRVPGATEKVHCVHCASLMDMRLRGGVHAIDCSGCGRTSDVEVCFNGSRWLVRTRPGAP